MRTRCGLGALVVIGAVTTMTGCVSPTPTAPSRQWYGASVLSPHTLAATKLGLSQGPYTVKCSGNADNLTVDVSAPDGWNAVFKSDSKIWTLRKTKDSESLKITGSPNGLSYLKYADYVVDSEALGETPQSWGIDTDTMSINMYIDCHPPQAPDPSSFPDSPTELPPGTPSSDTPAPSGKGVPGSP